MKLEYYISLFKVFILIVSVFSVLTTTSLSVAFAAVITIRILIIITIVLLIPYVFQDHDKVFIWPVKLFLIWNVICILRGLFVAENYWEWKNLTVVGLMFLLPLSVYIFTNKIFLQQILSFWIKYVFPLFIVLIPFAISSDFYGTYLSPILFFLLIMPLLPFKWKIIVLFCFVMVLLAGLESRSDIIRFSLALFLGSIYYFRFFIGVWIFKLFHAFFMVLPAVLLFLAIFNIFNIFNIRGYVKGNYTVSAYGNTNKKESLTADTRTFIYQENIDSALKHHYVIFGRTPANGYDSKWFGNYLKFFLHTGKLQRFSSEVGVLNIFTWNGIIGVFLYFLVFFWASFLAIYRSNNYFIKVIGLFVAFRWSYAFVEDFTIFGINYIILWVMISVCYATSFRSMSDLEFQHWVKGIFLKKNKNIITKIY